MGKTKGYLKKTLLYYKSIYFQLIFCTLIGLTRMGIMLLQPQIISLMVDRVINPALGNKPEKNSSIFWFLIKGIPEDRLWTIMGVLSVAFIVLMLIYFLTFYLRWNLIHYASTKVENRMRTDIVKKINHVGPSILKKYTNGELISIANSDTGKIRNMYVAIIPFIVDNVFFIIMAAYFLLRTNVALMICPLVVFAVYLLITKGFIKTFDKYYDEMWKKNSALNTEAQESIYGIRTVKAYAGEEYRYKRFEEKSEDIKKFHINFANTRYKYFFFYGATDQILMLITMAVSIYLASQLKMTNGEYTAFLGYLLNMVGCFVDIIFLIGDFQEGKVSGKRVFELLDMKIPSDEKFGHEKTSETPHIVLKNVYAQADNKVLIKNVNIDIPYGKKVGIMGKTGSGKSVFLKVIQGFTDFTQGNITIDGKDFYDYDKGEIAGTYSYAMQDVFLFSNTIAANIEFYKPEGNMERIKECGKLAEVNEFAYSFPDGYGTIVGEKGFGLSGGQKQRVAIARALYKNSPVIVLDDCTSALDVETEGKIFENIKKVSNDKTLLMATHRARAIKDFDEIIFFENGEIVERGTFKELIEAGGRYATIYHAQEDAMTL